MGSVLSRKVLLVDDNVGFGEFMTDLLEMDGHEVVFVSSLGEATIALREGRFDIVVVDYMIRHALGTTLADHIKANSPDTLVILVSALKGHLNNIVSALREKGTIDAFIEKPFTIKAFNELLKRLL